MKRTLFVIFLILLSTSSFGQKIRFTDSTNVWHWFEYICADDGSGGAYDDQYTGDTIIHSLLYKKLFHRNSTFYIREDTNAKKVFAIMKVSPYNDTAEQLLYDYNLTVGDTFRTHFTHFTHYVSSVDSTLVNGTWHKLWILRPDSSFYINDYIVIEGIGSSFHPLFPIYPIIFENCITLTCFYNNGSRPTVSPKVGYYFDNDTSCSLTFGVQTTIVKTTIKQTTTIPNPIDQTSKILFPQQITSGTATIINSVGQVISNIPFENKEELTIGDKIKVPGIYYYRVTDNISGETFSGKFVNQ